MDAQTKKINQLAAVGVSWAVKLKTGGWKLLTTAQKRAARAQLGLPTGPSVQPNLKVNRVSMPIAQSTQVRTGEPRVSTAQRSMTISFTERLGSVQASNGLVVSSWTLNPSIVSSFPQLSVNAVMYEKYKFTRLAFRFAPSCPTTTGGVVVVAFDPDSSDALPDDLNSLYNYSGAMRSSPYSPCRLQIPCDNLFRYIADNKASDPKLINFGKLLVANYGQVSGNDELIGEVFVEYTVVLQDRQPTTYLTQVWTRTACRGPALANFRLASTAPYTFTIVLNAAGKYLLTVHFPTAVVTALTEGSARILKLYGTGAGDECQAAEVLVSRGGQDLTFVAGDPTFSPTIMVARL